MSGVPLYPDSYQQDGGSHYLFARHGKAEQNGPETLRAKDPVARIRMSFTANSRVVGKLFWRALREFQRRIEATAYEQA